jgi:protein-disulfide isomerase/uncharacterized membrane protein
MSRFQGALVWVLVGAGVLFSGYLQYLHIDAAFGGGSGGLCSILFGSGCANALHSRYAMAFGIPLAAWGLLFYVGLAAHLLLRGFREPAPSKSAGSFALLAVTFAAVLGIAALVLMISGAAPFCAICTAEHIVSLSLLLVLRFSLGIRYSSALRTLWESLRSFLIVGDLLSAQQRHRLLNLLLVVLVGIVLYEWAYIVEGRIQLQSAQPDPVALSQAVQREKVHDIPLHPDDVMLGDTLAGARIVLFSDFSCPSCRELALELQKIQPVFGRHVMFVFKQFPLSSQCNHMVSENIHPGACLAARAAIAAHLQGAFWAYHDSLFQRTWSIDRSQLIRVAVSLHLDSARFVQDMDSDAVLGQVSRDIDLAASIGIDGTPALFINGRQMRDTRPRAVHALLEYYELSLRQFYNRMHPQEKSLSFDSSFSDTDE